jgi:hypothetical protein
MSLVCALVADIAVKVVAFCCPNLGRYLVTPFFIAILFFSATSLFDLSTNTIR